MYQQPVSKTKHRRRLKREFFCLVQFLFENTYILTRRVNFIQHKNWRKSHDNIFKRDNIANVKATLLTSGTLNDVYFAWPTSNKSARYNLLRKRNWNRKLRGTTKKHTVRACDNQYLCLQIAYNEYCVHR